jgi:pyrroloquinoline-quinone synthase
MRPAPTASFLDRLRAVGAQRYHDKHPFHQAMHAGSLTRDQMRGWVANRYYYQKNIPVKDALARAVGLGDAELRAETMVQPGTRFAVDAYVWFARSQPWLPAVASSLTELFAPDLMAKRIEALVEKYAWIDPAGLEYFRTRLKLAPEDSDHALAWVLEGALDTASQEACIAALHFKCDVLWAILDATRLAYGMGSEHDRK